MNLFSSNIVELFLIGIIFFFLYLIRKYELNKQQDKSELEKNEIISGMFQNAPFAVVLTDPDGKVISINEVFEVKFGFSRDELLGKKLDEFIIPEDRGLNNINKTGNNLDEHLQVYSISKRKHKQGKLIDIELFTSPNFIGEKNLGYILYYYDVTKRLEIEAKLEQSYITHREVLDTLQDAYFEGDTAGFITYANEAFVKATGYESKDELIGKHFRHFVSKESARNFLANFKKLFESNQPIQSFDLQYVRKDGTVYSSEIVASPIIEDGITKGSRGIIRDISVRVDAQKFLKEAKEAAEHRAQELASINRLSKMVNNSLDLNERLDSISKEFTNIFPIRSVGISLLNEKENSLEVLAFYSNNDSDISAKGILIPLDGSSEAVRMINSPKSVFIENAQTDARTKPIHELLKNNGTKSYLIVPLILRGSSIGTIGMSPIKSDYKFSSNEIEFAETISSQIASTIENARLYKRTELALDLVQRDLEIGSEIQSGFFPRFIPQISGWEVSAFFRPARQVSGDFYDIFQLKNSNRFAFVVADVCDKGVGAALFMVLLRSLIRSFSEKNFHEEKVAKMLQEIIDNVNKFIYINHGQSNMFATLFMSILDSTENKLYYVNCGHDPPYLLDSKGKLKSVLNPTGPAVGFSDLISFETEIIEFLEGDLLLSYTDGLTEAKNINENFYSDNHLLKIIQKKWSSTFSLIKFIEFDVLSHIGKQQQFDDITLLALRRQIIDEFIVHSISLPARLENLPTFRNFSLETSKKLSLNNNIIDKITLSIDEICSNIIMHGYKDMNVGEIELKFIGLDKELNIIIRDSGRFFDPKQSAAPNLSDEINEREIGGLGFFFVKELVDDIEYKSINGTNQLKLKIKYNL